MYGASSYFAVSYFDGWLLGRSDLPSLDSFLATIRVLTYWDTPFRLELLLHTEFSLKPDWQVAAELRTSAEFVAVLGVRATDAEVRVEPNLESFIEVGVGG